ncbi:MAG: transcriptional repressor [Fimbriimonadales bacterium]
MKPNRNSGTAVIADKKDSFQLVKEFEDHALTQLRIAGYRITMPRVQVIQALGDAETALSPYQIHQKILANRGRIDVVSVYRILNTLQDLGLVHYIGATDGYFPARNGTPQDKNAAHLINQETGDITVLPMHNDCLAAIRAEVEKLGVKPISVKIEVVAAEEL